MINEKIIQLIRVADSSETANELITIYEEAFPADERREWVQILDLLSNPDFNLFGIFDQQKTIGLLSVWNLHEFNFVEHLAIQDTERGKGLGNQAIQKFLDWVSTTVILEVEEPSTEMAQKRIAFYERLNFHVFKSDYFQPSYSTGKNKVKMLLMSFPEKLSPEKFISVRNKIYDTVYNFTE